MGASAAVESIRARFAGAFYVSQHFGGDYRHIEIQITLECVGPRVFVHVSVLVFPQVAPLDSLIMKSCSFDSLANICKLNNFSLTFTSKDKKGKTAGRNVREEEAKEENADSHPEFPANQQKGGLSATGLNRRGAHFLSLL
jgi:hypothetical protein